MINCAEICQTSANFLLSGSAFHQKVCAVCAEICDACAKSCEQVGGMEDCVKACRECAESCRKMAGAKRLAMRNCLARLWKPLKETKLKMYNTRRYDAAAVAPEIRDHPINQATTEST